MGGVELLIFEMPKLKKKKKNNEWTSQKRCQENPEPPLLDPLPEAFTLLVELIMQLQQGKNHCQPPHPSGWVGVLSCALVSMDVCILPHTLKLLHSFMSADHSVSEWSTHLEERKTGEECRRWRLWRERKWKQKREIKEKTRAVKFQRKRARKEESKEMRTHDYEG